MGWGSEFVLDVFEQELDVERGSEGFEVLDGSEREVEGLGGPAVVLLTEMKGAGPEGDLFGSFQGALDFIHGEDALRFVTRNEIEGGLCVAGPLKLFGLSEDRHVHGGLDRVGAEPVGEFPHGVAVRVVKVVT